MELNVDAKKLRPKGSLAKIRGIFEFSANFKKISKIISNYNPNQISFASAEAIKTNNNKRFPTQNPKILNKLLIFY